MFQFYIELNDPYINMNTSAQEGKDDYLKMVSAPDYTLLSSPNHEYMNTSTASVSNPGTHKSADSKDQKNVGAKNSEVEEPSELAPMLNEEEDNYLKPINVHEKRAEFVRQRQSKNASELEDKSSSNYYNTPTNIHLIDLKPEFNEDVKDGVKSKEQLGIIRTQDNYVNMPKQKSNFKNKTGVPGSFSNPTYIFMESKANVQSSEV